MTKLAWLTDEGSVDEWGIRDVAGPHALRERIRGAKSLAVAIAIWAVIGAMIPAAVGQLPAVETVKRIEIKQPAGEVKAFASEPMVQNPTSVVVDSRGRVWVTEGLNYRLWIKAQQKNFKRVAGADRIKILEDTDGDGSADRVTVFAENIFPVPMGLAIEEHWEDGEYRGCRVFVGNSPNLLVLEDRDGDDRADHREPLLAGFRGVDSDHGIHGLQLGIDGWLYFTVGDTRYGVNQNGPDEPTFDVTDRSGRRLTSSRYGTVCRVRPDGTQMEVLAHRLRNDYEVCVDSFGHRFLSDNDDDGQRGCRICWVLPGGNYGYRMPGARLHSAEEMPGIVPKIAGTGNGSPGGLLVYEGGSFQFPDSSTLLEVDAGTRQINLFPLKVNGSAFRTKASVWLAGTDDWFRPIDLDVAPDGSIYLCDWYDAGVGGNRVSDQTTGRIYRIAPAGVAPTVQAWNRATLEGAIEGLKSPNRTAQILARTLLLEQAEAAEQPLIRMLNSKTPHLRARALWVLSAMKSGRQRHVVAALKDEDPLMRELALKALTEDPSRDSVVVWPDGAPPPARAVAWLQHVLPLAGDSSPLVRRQLLVGLRHVPTRQAETALIELALAWDGRDRFYLEALRLALVDREPELIVKLFARLLDRGATSDLAVGDPLAIPPYYPTSANDAYLRPEERLPLSSPVTCLSGIAWSLQRPEAIEVLKLVYRDRRRTADERTAIESALVRISGAASGMVLVESLESSRSDGERRRLLLLLARHVRGPWKELSQSPRLAGAVEQSLQSPQLQVAAVELAGAARLVSQRDRLRDWIHDADVDMTLRAASLEALQDIDRAAALEISRRYLQEAGSGAQHSQLAEVAIALVGRSGTAGEVELAKMVVSESLPDNLRRQVVLGLSRTLTGSNRLLSLIQREKLDEHWSEVALQMLANHPHHRIKQQARDELIRRGGATRRLVDFDTVLALSGDSASGQRVFFRAAAGSTACGACHRVRGIGQWVGPDLSTIGQKYGKRELLFHIAEPSAVINHNYSGSLLLMEDGRVLSGIVVAEDARRIVLKTTQGERLELDPEEVEQRKPLAESVMPGNLCDSLTDQQLADLLAFLSRLRTAVVEVRSVRVLGPVSSRTMLATDRAVDLSAAVRTETGESRRWRRLEGDREGRLRLPAASGSSTEEFGWLAVPVRSESPQRVEIVLYTEESARAFLGSRSIQLTPYHGTSSRDAGLNQPVAMRAVTDLPAKSTVLWLRVPLDAGGNSAVITLVPQRADELHVN